MRVIQGKGRRDRIVPLGRTAAGYFDDEWKQPTQELWRQMESGLWRFVTSLVTSEELIEAPERVRNLFNTTFEAADVLNRSRSR